MPPNAQAARTSINLHITGIAMMRPARTKLAVRAFPPAARAGAQTANGLAAAWTGVRQLRLRSFAK